MREVGIDIAQERPKELDLEMQLHADWAITLGCGGACPYVPTRVDDWDIPDPHGQSLAEVREIRDELERRVLDFIAHRLDDLRPTAPRTNCDSSGCCPTSTESSATRIPPTRSAAAPTPSSTQYDDAPVRSLVATIAYRETRECLRDDRCADMVVA